MRIARLLLITTCLLTVIPAGVLSPQELPRKEAPPKFSQPFSLGERLVYLVKWDPPWYLFFLPTMEAGEIVLQLLEDSQQKDKKLLKISFQVLSSGTLLKLAGMKIEDEFIFITEPETFCTLSVSQKIREGKRKRQIDVEYLRDTHQLHIREMDESVTPPQLKKDEIKDKVPPCVQDPLSALYYFRKSELGLNHIQTFMIGYTDRIKEVKTRVEKKENLDTPLGKIDAWNVSTSSLMGGVFKDGGQFRIWLSADYRKLPLQFDVKVSMGRVLGKLQSVENPAAFLADRYRSETAGAGHKPNSVSPQGGDGNHSSGPRITPGI